MCCSMISADRGEQARNIAPAHPLPAARIEHGLQFLDDEGHIAAAPENRADHPGQRHRPGVMLQILGVDENLERPAPPVLNQIVDGDIDRVIAVRPFQLVGIARQHLIAFERLRHIDHVGLARPAIGALESGKRRIRAVFRHGRVDQRGLWLRGGQHAPGDGIRPVGGAALADPSHRRRDTAP